MVVKVVVNAMIEAIEQFSLKQSRPNLARKCRWSNDSLVHLIHR
jgi:hypothetical protein